MYESQLLVYERRRSDKGLGIIQLEIWSWKSLIEVYLFVFKPHVKRSYIDIELREKVDH
jgi:hypothetical protein